MHRGLPCLGLAFKARWLRGFLSNLIFGTKDLMAGHTLVDPLPSCKDGDTSGHQESSAHYGKSGEPCMRCLLVAKASGQSKKVKVTIIIVVIGSCGFGAIAIIAFRLCLVGALLVVLRLVPSAYKPALTTWVFLEVLSTALFILLVTRECQVWASVRYFGAVPTFGAFFAALPIAVHFCETCLAWLLTAAFDHAILP